MANSGREANRIMQLQAKQEQKKKDQAEERKKVHEENTVRIGSIDSQFEAKSTSADDMLVQNTVGLVSLADYKKTKSLIEENLIQEQMAEESRKRGTDEHEDGRKKKKKKKKKVATSKLSFGDEVEEEEEAAAAAAAAAPKERLGKCTTVDTAYLPDRERAVGFTHAPVRPVSSWVNCFEQIACVDSTGGGAAAAGPAEARLGGETGPHEGQHSGYHLLLLGRPVSPSPQSPPFLLALPFSATDKAIASKHSLSLSQSACLRSRVDAEQMASMCACAAVTVRDAR